MFNVLLSVILSLSLVQAETSDPLEPNPNKPLGDVIPIEKAVSEFEKQYEKK
ncbi:hypothetical protein [Halalkalibacter okhensis]|uniref:hypothetical protein n=1 Tax=Halalkalibacter okhensis TaxID=333138 RepID=UPI000B29FBB5|nr:hypothetical protein [Halalkalibacter okhensis]